MTAASTCRPLIAETRVLSQAIARGICGEQNCNGIGVSSCVKFFLLPHLLRSKRMQSIWVKILGAHEPFANIIVFTLTEHYCSGELWSICEKSEESVYWGRLMVSH
jgi:hypothetical protein